VTRWRTIFAHELRTQVTSASFIALVLLLVAVTSTLNPVAMIPGGSSTDQPVRAIANSVYALAPTFAMSGFFVYPFFAALMAGLSVLRDKEAGVSELLHSTSLTRAEYLWAKFGGVAGALLLGVVMHVVIVMTFREMGGGGVALGPFSPSAYLVAVSVFVVPGVLWMAGLTFVIGARTEAPMAVYVVPVALFVLEFVLLWNWHPIGIDPTLDAALMVIDPTGLRWLSHSLFTDDRGIVWYNSAPLAIDRVLVLGRVATLALPLAMVALMAHGRQRVASTGPWRLAMPSALFRRRSSATATATAAAAFVRSFGGLDVLHMTRRTPTTVRATTTVLVAELRSLARQPSGYLFALFLFAVVAEVGGAEADVYGSIPVLTAGGVAINALPAVTVLTCLFLLFVIVESLHRDRATGFEAIVFSSPVPTLSFIMGKALAAIALIGVFTAVCVISGGLLLLTQSGAAVSLWPLLLVFGAVLGPTYVLWTAFVTAVMSLVQSRTAALAIGFVALLLTAAQFIRGSMTWVTNWPLLGSLRWTEFALFPLDGEALLLNRLLALGLAVALFGAARFLFVRTERDPAAARARRTPAAIGRLVLRASPLVALPVFTGTLLAVRVHDAYDGPVVARAAAAYEARNQRQWASVIPAVIQHVDADVALDPPHRAVNVDGTYDLVNRTATPMATLPFTVPYAFGRMAWRVDGVPVHASGADGLAVLRLATPLAPGDTIQVGFQYVARINDGVSRNGGPVEAFILPSSVLLSTHRGDFLPIPGYRGRPSATLSAAGSRPSASVDTTSNGAGYFNRGWAFTATLRVRAPRELTVNGVGQQTASTTIGHETVTSWETREPVSALALVGAAYAVRRSDGVAVYHHPLHTRSLDVIVETLAAARRRYAAWFFPYPWSELRLSEYADLSSQATSYPTNIAFSEGLGFLTIPGDSGGLAFAVTAHEAAHQWWGHLLTAGTGPGTGMLVEGMADYATLLLYDAERGAAARRAYATLLERQYLEGRQASRERSLVESDDAAAADEVVLQKKGAWAMWMLHQSLGADRTFAGLRAFIAAHRAPGRFATLEGLLSTLRRQATDTLLFDAHVSEWFRSNRLPAFSLHDAHCQADDGEWLCHATLRNDGTGTATVEVLAARERGDRMRGDLMVVAADAGASTVVRWRLPQRPDRVVVDPEVRVLQAARERGQREFVTR
jgi:ABC-type transport system involved in multi-copper enzyme maturation permease subunit